MINIPLEAVIQKIREKSGMTDTEINTKIQAKLDQLSGLISKEGAAHIIANELGINLTQAKGIMKISNLIAGLREVQLAGKVLKKYELRTFENPKRSGKLSKFLIGDETGTTMVVMWNDKADLINSFAEGDIIKITKAAVRENQGRKELHLSDDGAVEVNPKGIKIEVTEKPSPQGFGTPVRKKISELTDSDSNVEIFVTIVQVFDPKFFKVDAETGKKAKEDQTENIAYGAVLNVFADDGSDNIRVVMWKNQILNFLNIDEQKLTEYREKPELFEAVKTDMLGSMVKIIGRVVKNEMFGRPEFIANIVITDVNPEQELKNIEKNPPKQEHPADITEKKEEKKSVPETEQDELLSLEDIEDLEEDY